MWKGVLGWRADSPQSGSGGGLDTAVITSELSDDGGHDIHCLRPDLLDDLQSQQLERHVVGCECLVQTINQTAAI